MLEQSSSFQVISAPSDNSEEFDDCPCNECEKNGTYCDDWDALYCCTFCRWFYNGDPDEDGLCDDCNPMDI